MTLISNAWRTQILGAQFQLDHAEHYEGLYIEFKKPKWASATPLKLSCCIVGGGDGLSPYIPVKLTFLGSGVFMLRCMQ
jgi:hypothetical protein